MNPSEPHSNRRSMPSLQAYALAKRLSISASRPGNITANRRTELRRQAHNVAVAGHSLRLKGR